MNPKWKAWVNYRKQHINQIEKNDAESRILIHCASLGEYEQIKVLGKKLKEANHHVILSMFSSSGVSVVEKEKNFYDQLVFLPLDTKGNARQFLDKLKPDLVVMVKYEFWFNFLNELVNRKIPFVYVDCVINKESKYLKWPLSSLFKILRNSEKVFVQELESKNALIEFGLASEKLQITGDSRIDSILFEKSKDIKFKNLENLDRKMIIFGSIHNEDVEIINTSILAFPDILHIIVPHEIESESIESIEDDIKVDFVVLEMEKAISSNYMIVKELGVLKHLYKYADVAYIGGGFGEGLHNSLEALIYNVPCIGGPASESFPEVEHFEKEGMFIKIEEAEQFISSVKKLLPSKKQNQKINDFFTRKSGTETIFAYIENGRSLPKS